jgi:hypothetical protein
MNQYTDSRQISISSSSANFLYNSTFKSSVSFTFFGMLQDEPDLIQAQLSVHSAQIPISYYVVNIYNRTLKYKYHDDPVTTVIFDVGNYNANTFITEMKNKIPHLNVLFNRINGKYSFDFNQPTTFYASGSTCFKILGLDLSQDYTGTIITAPYPCQFQGITRIRIASNTFSTYSMDSLAGTFSNTLAIIPVNSGSYGILLYENNASYKPTLRNTTINDFDLMLLDDDENLINFNNVDWNITLQLDITRLRRENDKLFPNFRNILPTAEEVPQDAVNTDNQENVQVSENQDAPLFPTTGDDDLDFLLYQQNIYQ